MLIGILFIGSVLVLLGSSVVVRPRRLRNWLHRFLTRGWLPMLTFARILVGGVLIIWSSETQAPGLVLGIGLLFLVAGLVLPLIGERRAESVAHWWLGRGDGWMRGWGVAVALIGGLLCWAGL